MNRQPFRIVAVSADALREKLLDALVGDRNSHDVIFVESLASAYSRIRQLLPELILVLMRIDDEPACRLLTMLQTDRELYGISVLTWVTGQSEGETDHVIASPVSAGGCAVAPA